MLANDVVFPVYQEASLESGIVKELTSGYQVKLTGRNRRMVPDWVCSG